MAGATSPLFEDNPGEIYNSPPRPASPVSSVSTSVMEGDNLHSPPGDPPAAANSPIPAGLLQKLIEKGDLDAITVIQFLSDRLVNAQEETNVYINFLERTLSSNPDGFDEGVNRISRGVQNLQHDPRLRQLLGDIYREFLNEDASESSVDGQMSYLSSRDFKSSSSSAKIVLRSVHALSKKQQQNMVAWCKKLLLKLETVELKQFIERNAFQVGIVAAQLSCVALLAIYRCFKGEITGYRCAKIVIDESVVILAGVGGGIAGEKAGEWALSLINPIFAPVGGVIGAFVGSTFSMYIATELINWLTCKLFKLPRSEGLENAYQFMGLKLSCSNSDVNNRYHQMALGMHPDKGGNREDWIRLQSAVALIREAREHNRNP